MKLPHRRQFLHLAAGAIALPAFARAHGLRIVLERTTVNA
jgi:hypothetical protein